MKKIILLTLLLFIPIVTATICEDRMDNGSSCIMMTPALTCSDYTYDIHLVNGTTISNNATLTLLNGSKYYFNFTNKTGDYIITLCDDSTREFRVTETYDTKFQQEEDSRMYLAMIIAVGITLLIFIVLTIAFEANWLKMLFGFMALLSMLVLTNLARLIAVDMSASANIVDMLVSVYKISLYTVYIISALIATYALYRLFMYLKASAGFTRSDSSEKVENEWMLK